MNTSSNANYSARIGFGISLLSVVIISTEIILTRIFSVIIWNHFAFFAISVALFGIGTASILIYLRQRVLLPEKTEVLLAKYGIILSISIAVVDVLLLNVTPDWFGEFGTYPFTDITFRLLFLFVVAAVPFFIGGMAMSLAMTRYSLYIHRLYFWDLVGAGIGCLIVIPFLNWWGGPTALLASAVIAALSGLIFSLSVQSSTTVKVYRLIAITTMCAIPIFGALNSTHHLLEVRVAKGIHLDVESPEFNRWNSFSMVSVFGDKRFDGWAMSPIYYSSIPEQKTLIIDMNALTPIIRFDGSFSKVRQVFFDLSAFVYRILINPEHVCVIGAGGGKDVLAALIGGAKNVTGVEINPLIAEDVMKDKYRKFSGKLYFRDDVTIKVEDGRSFIRRTKQLFDVILLSMVDTSASTAAGAYVLTENGLYTSDAFRDYMSRLKPGGILSVSTVSMRGLYSGARLAALARDALISLGKDPSKSVLIAQAGWKQIHGGTVFNVMIKPDGYTAREIITFIRNIRLLRFYAGYIPNRSITNPSLEQIWVSKILTQQDSDRLAKQMKVWPVDVSSVSDDRPYFAYQNRFRDFIKAFLSGTRFSHLFGNGLVILAKVTLLGICMVLLFLILPAILAHRDLRVGRGKAVWDLCYVACLGMGFMFLEIALIQRLMLYLGNPTYALTVVLFILLVSGGIGSRLFIWCISRGLSSRLLMVAFLLIIVYAATLGTHVSTIFNLTISWQVENRALLCGLMLAPLGLLLGMPFPTGLSEVSKRAVTRIPWLWSINSATSVLGSIFATMTSLHAGITASLIVGLLLYGLALLLWQKVRLVS